MIYTVKRGDTLYQIAENYGISLESLISANGINRPNDLAIGQNLFIPTQISSGTYTVAPGDTMYLISRRLGITLNELIALNPQITNPNIINVGDVINIPGGMKKDIEVNGYAIANISNDTLNSTLPYLTYLSIFSYQARSNGSLTPLFEENLITAARSERVAPMMVVTNIGENGFDSDIASTILNTPQTSEIFINNIINIVTAKNYAGVNIDFEYLYPNDRESFITFLRNLKSRLSDIGKLLTVAVAPKYRDNQQGILYEAHDYRAIGEIADRVIIMTYEWGYLYGEPMAISPYSEVDAVISYAVTRIPPEKILMGVPNYAYDWALPFTPGNSADAITNTRALDIALDKGANIMFDERSQSPYFNYTDDAGVSHVVWFEDARSFDTKLNIVDKYNLAGISIWTINNLYPVYWSILNNRYNIKKII